MENGIKDKFIVVQFFFFLQYMYSLIIIHIVPEILEVLVDTWTSRSPGIVNEEDTSGTACRFPFQSAPASSASHVSDHTGKSVRLSSTNVY